MKKYSTIKNMILVVAVLLLFISIYNYFSMFIFHPTLNYYIATAGVFVEDIAISLILLSISGSIKSIKKTLFNYVAVLTIILLFVLFLCTYVGVIASVIQYMFMFLAFAHTLFQKINDMLYYFRYLFYIKIRNSLPSQFHVNICQLLAQFLSVLLYKPMLRNVKVQIYIAGPKF
ncbi:hypothetical protein KF146HA_00422 [Lactococcus lactis]|nr:hypothetical protein [Lactococcus lactis]